MGKIRQSRGANAELGLGVIEIVVSMFLLGILAISFIPMLTNSLLMTSRTATTTTAIAIVSQQIEGARAVRSTTSTSPSCQNLTNFMQVATPTLTDSRGVKLTPVWDPTTCPSVYPGVVRVRSSIMLPGTTTELASAVTLIFVASAAG